MPEQRHRAGRVGYENIDARRIRNPRHHRVMDLERNDALPGVFHPLQLLDRDPARGMTHRQMFPVTNPRLLSNVLAIATLRKTPPKALRMSLLWRNRALSDRDRCRKRLSKNGKNHLRFGKRGSPLAA